MPGKVQPSPHLTVSTLLIVPPMKPASSQRAGRRPLRLSQGAGATLLLLASLYSSPGRGELPADNILQQIKLAARAQLTRQAEQARLHDPEFEIVVAPPAQPLAACAQAPTVELQDARQPSRMRFVALCGGGAGWRREFVVRATIFARVGVLREAVAPGAPLGPREVALERRDITQVADAVSDLDVLSGMVSRRTLRAGELLRLNQLVAPQLVKRGAAVRIVGRAARVEVSVAGEALDNGALDALVRVRNASSGAVIRARVTGPDTVQPADQPANPQSSD